MTPRERAQRLPGQVATTDAGGKPISYCVVSVDAIEGTIVAAIADAKRDASREACDLCHCCGEQRHDGGDPCVSCTRAIAEEREATIKKYQAWQERAGPNVVVPWQIIFVGDTTLTPEDILRGQEVDTALDAAGKEAGR